MSVHCCRFASVGRIASPVAEAREMRLLPHPSPQSVHISAASSALLWSKHVSARVTGVRKVFSKSRPCILL